MKWEAIAAVAELLGALGVIASLVYLAGQVRSNTSRARQAAIQSVVNQMNKVWTDVSADRGHADVWVRGSKGFSNLEDEIDGVRFSAFLLSIFRPYEEIFHYRRDGLVDDWTWESIVNQCHALMGTPGFQQWWDKRGDWFSTLFQQHVNEVVQALPDYERWTIEKPEASSR
jgi:hypothetical protein